MALNDLFTIKSKKQSQQEAEQYERKIFPFGQQQKERIRSFLKENVHPQRITDREVFFQYVVMRQLLADNKLDEGYSRWYHAGLGKLLTHQDKAFIRAYAILDSQLEDAQQQIERQKLDDLARQLEAEAAPEKPRRRFLRF